MTLTLQRQTQIKLQPGIECSSETAVNLSATCKKYSHMRIQDLPKGGRPWRAHGVRVNNRDLGQSPHRGPRTEPPVRVRGAKPPEAKGVFVYFHTKMDQKLKEKTPFLVHGGAPGPPISGSASEYSNILSSTVTLSLGFYSTGPFFRSYSKLGWSPKVNSWELLWLNFYRLDALPVAQPTASKHWMMLLLWQFGANCVTESKGTRGNTGHACHESFNCKDITVIFCAARDHIWLHRQSSYSEDDYFKITIMQRYQQLF